MVIAIDFDGTVVDHRYPAVGLDLPNAVRVMKRIVANGHHVMLYTMRSGAKLEEAKTWYRYHGIPLYSVNTDPHQLEWTSSPKAHADMYIDDRGLGIPLLRESWMAHPGVDWEAVEKMLELRGILKQEKA
jgi:hypothetical protein